MFKFQVIGQFTELDPELCACWGLRCSCEHHAVTRSWLPASPKVSRLGLQLDSKKNPQTHAMFSFSVLPLWSDVFAQAKRRQLGSRIHPGTRGTSPAGERRHAARGKSGTRGTTGEVGERIFLLLLFSVPSFLLLLLSFFALPFSAVFFLLSPRSWTLPWFPPKPDGSSLWHLQPQALN